MSKIFPAMLQAMQEIGAIGKNRKNPQQGYSYRGIDDFLNNLQPALIKAKIFILPRLSEVKQEERPSKSGGTLIYTTVKGEFDFISAEDGSVVTATTYGEGMDSSDKSTNKAMSAALKYAVIMAFSVPTQELIDSETDSPTPEHKAPPPKTDKPSSNGDKISDAQRRRFYGLYKDAGKEDEAVKAYLKEKYNIEHSTDIPKSKYDEICAWAQSK